MNTSLSLVTAMPLWAGLTALQPKWVTLIAGAVGSVLVSVAVLCTEQPAAAQFMQQGPPLIGTGASGAVVPPENHIRA
jgi:hypothetical protein